MLMDGLWLYDANGIGHHLLTQGRKDGRLYLTLPYAFKVDPSLFLYGCSTLSSSGQKSQILRRRKSKDCACSIHSFVYAIEVSN